METKTKLSNMQQHDFRCKIIEYDGRSSGNRAYTNVLDHISTHTDLSRSCFSKYTSVI